MVIKVQFYNLDLESVINPNARNWFRGLVGYGICLTRRTSPVRSWAKSVFPSYALFFGLKN